jgi:hypothetical protein
MRHPLDVLLRIGRSAVEREALRGDLAETYRRQVRPARSWIGAQAWYAGEVLAAPGIRRHGDPDTRARDRRRDRELLAD